jgi:hypothetical protein
MEGWLYLNESPPTQPKSVDIRNPYKDFCLRLLDEDK